MINSEFKLIFLFLGKNSIPLIAQSAYEKFTAKVKNRRTSTFFMGFAFGAISAYIIIDSLLSLEIGFLAE
jgi:hypothetical protein